jgi:tRNA (cytidine/uridine-2'-O-)-methyltransferase
MFDVVLIQPEIPMNTGNIIRLCANTGARLHLVEPLGFRIDDASLRRAALDYSEFATMQVHRSWADCADSLHSAPLAGGLSQERAMFGLSSDAPASVADTAFEEDDVFVFGRESAGLSGADRDSLADPPGRGGLIRIPMRSGNRSMNLANAVAVVVYEAWRQLGYEGAVRSAGPQTAEELGAEPFDR